MTEKENGRTGEKMSDEMVITLVILMHAAHMHMAMRLATALDIVKQFAEGKLERATLSTNTASVKVSEIIGMYISDPKDSIYNRQVAAMEKIAKAASDEHG